MSFRTLFFISFIFLLNPHVEGQNYSVLIEEEIAEGLQWRQEILTQDDSPVVINLLIIRNGLYVFDIVSSDSLIYPSRFAQLHNALLVINGSFFNIKEGGSAVFFQNNKKIEFDSDSSERITEEGALAIDRSNLVSILEKPAKGWKKNRKYKDILASGPILLNNGLSGRFDDRSFVVNKHPRTAVGITKENDVIFVVADGRNSNSVGLTIPELMEYMLHLGCISAINLDGGGSSAMWIKGKTQSGIVNFPSDNRTFDHKGERKIANAIIIR